MCKDKDEYITSPDFGRKFSRRKLQNIKDTFDKSKGISYSWRWISSAAIEANLEDVFHAIKQGLKMYGIE